MKALLSLLGIISTTAIGSAASLIVDSFTEGSYMLTLGGDTSATSVVTSPFGSSRAAGISNRIAAPGTTMTSTLDTGTGSVSFGVNGQSTGSGALHLGMSYSQGGPFSLLGYDAFELDFSSLSGTGFLIVGIGSPPDVYGPATHRVPLNSSGTVTVPFNLLNHGTSGAIDSFIALNFEFEAESQEFSFGLDEIRVVPEASTVLLVVLSAGTLLLRRRQH